MFEENDGEDLFPNPGRCRAMSSIPAIPVPRDSSHLIPVIPIWRGFELFFFIPSKARDPYNLELCWENDGDDLFPDHRKSV